MLYKVSKSHTLLKVQDIMLNHYFGNRERPSYKEYLSISI